MLWSSARTFSTAARAIPASARTVTTQAPASSEPLTHYKITLRRSGISLGEKVQGTLKSLSLHRRNKTVYFPHSSVTAGMILKVKELLDVENVPASEVKTQEEQRKLRKPPRGYTVVASRQQ
ncbi:hypothetical protein CYLTODRAFT_387205 [Cylindrobasidium torrendii FP15055 ss-10]|uniref:Large ribosomal subunit protein uL30m n=1 Tax=Cylindrobasidium torrendii FP15055 ss-10 TaxID=1314674 RepID=A0A0D7BS32_9AGAR|nr:hypothetical protein CYLTODRAFT_387205 [Cylindrobasidium torrendii FP15055 ss-10]